MTNQTTTLSDNYAKALIEIASETNSFDQIKEQLYSICECVHSSNELQIVMNNSAITTNKKVGIIDDIFKNKIDEKLLNFLKILIKNSRFKELDSIYASYCKISNKFSNKQNVEIISAIPLEKAQKVQILKKLQQKLKSNIIPNWQNDESIIAGLIFKFGDYIIDTSIKSKLEKLSKNI